MAGQYCSLRQLVIYPCIICTTTDSDLLPPFAPRSTTGVQRFTLLVALNEVRPVLRFFTPRPELHLLWPDTQVIQAPELGLESGGFCCQLRLEKYGGV